MSFSTNISIGYATSTNGIDWDKHPDPVLEGDAGTWNENGVVNPMVYYDGAIYHMWFGGWAGDSGIYDHTLIGYATSSNGIEWDKYPDPVLGLGPQDSFYDTWVIPGKVLSDEDTLQMWFTGWDGTNTSPFCYFRIGHATSTDGIDWTVQNDREPVLDVGGPGAWDKYHVRDPSVLIIEDQYMMWYYGNGSNERNIGLACWPPCMLSGIQPKTSLDQQLAIIYPNPCSDVVNLRYSISDTRNLKLEIYTVSGIRIKTLLDSRQLAGEYDLEFDVNDLPAGVYFAVLKSNDSVQTLKLVKY